MARATKPTAQPLPDLTGTRALVTGATGNLGHIVAATLARQGAEVLVAARNRADLTTTLKALRARNSGATFEAVIVDVGDLASLRQAAQHVIREYERIDLLIHNAGVMATPYVRTVDGFELQMATNHLGPFAFTGLLWPALLAAPQPRVVSVTAPHVRLARVPPTGDPRLHRPQYRRWDAFVNSKLAALMFALELNERAAAAGLPLQAMAAHGGFCATQTHWKGPNLGLVEEPTTAQRIVRRFGQPPSLGARSIVMAATADLPGGSYVAPRGLGSLGGRPKVIRPGRLAKQVDQRARLWEISEHATAVSLL